MSTLLKTIKKPSLISKIFLNISLILLVILCDAQENFDSKFDSLFVATLHHINKLSPQYEGKETYSLSETWDNTIIFQRIYAKKNIHMSSIDYMARLLIDSSRSIQDEDHKRNLIRRLINRNYLELLVKADRTDYEKRNSLLSLNTRNALLILSLIETYLDKPYLGYEMDKNIVKQELKKVIELYTAKTYCFYDYPSSKKSILKYINIHTGNDLFLPGTIKLNSHRQLKISNANFDRAYTGSVKLEFGTDLLKASKTAFTKQYQSFFFGLDVYTPYFKDTSIFNRDDTFNVNDYPHANFIYLGRSVYKLYRTGLYRDRMTIKVGKIGGNAGRVFQESIHFDISDSPGPLGWKTQIANGGRIGIELEYEGENQLLNPKQLKWFYLNSNQGFNVGTYQTNYFAGLNISNRSFNYTNQLGVCNKGRYFKWIDRFYTTLGINYKRNIHNTMIEGYGLFNTKLNDTENLLNNNQKVSKYKIESGNVLRNVWEFSYRIAYTFKTGTIMYSFHSRSPEAKFDSAKFPHSIDGNRINLNSWFQWGEVGLILHSFK